MPLGTAKVSVSELYDDFLFFVFCFLFFYPLSFQRQAPLLCTWLEEHVLYYLALRRALLYVYVCKNSAAPAHFQPTQTQTQDYHTGFGLTRGPRHDVELAL